MSGSRRSSREQLFLFLLLALSRGTSHCATGTTSSQSVAIDIWQRLINTRQNIPRNRGKLIVAYTSICPVQDGCDAIPSSVITYNVPATISNCPKCGCYPNCISTRSCCVGEAHSYLEYACVNTIRFPPNHHNKYSYNMIVKCAETYNGMEEIRSRCQNNEHENDPVTSMQTYITYKNRFCAICNYDAHDLIPWENDVLCQNETDKIFFQSFSELKLAVQENKCVIKSVLPSRYIRYTPPYCFMDRDELIDKCNISGQWGGYNPDIDWACAHMNLAYREFKNVFCYICNPGVSASTPRGLINSCNVTGKWKTYQRDMELACLQGPENPRMSPYKNIHCWFCNSYGPYSDNVFMKRDQVVRFNEMYNLHNYSDVNVSVTVTNRTLLKAMDNFVKEWFHGGIQMQRNQEPKNATVNEPNELQEKGKHKNGQDILFKQISYYEDICGQHVCNSTIKAGYNGTARGRNISDNIVCGRCICGAACAAHLSCCPDFILAKEPYSSIRQSDLLTFMPSEIFVLPSTAQTETKNSNSKYLVVSKCQGDARTDDEIMNKCHATSASTSFKDVLLHIPVYSEENSIPYKNIYCLLCNSPEASMAIVHLRLQCQGFMDMHLFGDLSKFLNVAKTLCVISTAINLHALAQYINESHIDGPGVMYVRRQSPVWNSSYTSNDLNMVIEDVFIKPSDHYEYYTRCNRTGKYFKPEQAVIELCEGTSETIFVLPKYIYNQRAYKNFACFLCNPVLNQLSFDRSQIVNECNVTGLWTQDPRLPIQEHQVAQNATQDLCESAIESSRWLPFKNMYCSKCNLMHPNKEYFVNWGPTDNSQSESYMSGYRTLFSLNSHEWQEFTQAQGKDSTSECSNGTFDKNKNICRDVVCSEGRLLYNNTCRSLLEAGYNVIYSISFFLTLTADSRANTKETTEAETEPVTFSEDSVDLDRLCLILEMSIYNALTDASFGMIFCQFAWKLEDSETCRRENATPVNRFVDGVHVLLNLGIAKTNNIARTEAQLLKVGSKMYQIQSRLNRPLHFQGSDINEVSVHENVCTYERSFLEDVDEYQDLAERAIRVDKFLSCPQVQLKEDEYTVDMGRSLLILTDSNLTFGSESFRLVPSSARICLEDFVARFAEATDINMPSEKPIHYIYDIFSTVCTVLSLVCLAFAVFTYSVFASLRTLPGKNNMTLCVTLFSAQTCLQLGVYVPNSTVMCSVIGVVLHYFWLATFCSMNVCSYHMFKVFYLQSLTAQHSLLNHKHFCHYVLYVVLAPLFVVVGTLIGHFIAFGRLFHGYGRYHCFISGIPTLVVTFIIPSMLVFLTNIVFFSLTMHKIRSTPHLSHSGSRERHDVVLLIKLCTIVGITWPMLLVDANFKLSIFSFFVVAVNALQGVFIFIAYICNPRVLSLYRMKFGRLRPYRSSTQSSHSNQSKTRSTQLSETSLSNERVVKKRTQSITQE